jgi:hypothetical protein
VGGEAWLSGPPGTAEFRVASRASWREVMERTQVVDFHDFCRFLQKFAMSFGQEESE